MIRGWNYGNWIETYFKPTGSLDELSPKSLDSAEGMQILTIPALHANIANITTTELRSGCITRMLPIFKVAWPYTKGAGGYSDNSK